MTSALKLFQTANAHGSYGSVAASPTGQAPTAFVTAWLKAVARDVADSGASGVATTVPSQTDVPTDASEATEPQPADSSGFRMPGITSP